VAVPAHHPLHAMQRQIDAVLRKLSPLWDELVEELGRPGIPPEPRLKARERRALSSVRSQRLFWKPLGDNPLGLWFLDRPFRPGRFHPSVLAPNSVRVLSAEGIRLFLAKVEARARPHGWTGDEHFGADGARVESWASLESFVRQHGRKAQKLQAGKEEDSGHPTLDFGGQTRSHATHRRRADPDSGWDRKAQGQEARLGLGGPVLRDNRRGLGVEFRILDPMAEPEPEVALQPAARVEALPSGVRGRTAGATRPSLVRSLWRVAGSGGCATGGLQAQAARGGLGPAHDGSVGLSFPSEAPQACGGDFGLDPDGGRLEMGPGSRAAAGGSVGRFCGGRLQCATDGAVESGGRRVKRPR